MHPIRRINTIFVYVRDLAAAKRFYSETLSFGKPEIDGKFWVEFKLPDGDTHFALHQSEAHDKADRVLGTIKLSFEVTDIHKFAEQLRQHGVKFHYEPRKEYGFWLAEFEDPEGNVLRLYQRLHVHERAK
ncbi:MAG: VOC family protein [Verrucomicrobia bacterium]|nr:VOC family protein [Verrucomicrobiota bacterium]